MSIHTACCNDLDRTLCGQSLEVVGCEGDRCSLCEMLFQRRPLMCPLGGNCTKVGSATQPMGSQEYPTGDHSHGISMNTLNEILEPQLKEVEDKLASGLNGLLRGKVGDKPRWPGRDRNEWWVDGVVGSRGGTPRTDTFSDEELLNFVHERYQAFPRHQRGWYACPCWRCSMLRDVGFYPDQRFDPDENDYFVRTIREGKQDDD